MVRGIEFRRALDSGGADCASRFCGGCCKVTPPQPRRILFPPLRLLLGLKDEEQTPAHTPWWLLLLRLSRRRLLILALADPLLGRAVKILGNGPLVLVVDNGWAAAKNWDQRQTLIADLLRAAGDRPVAIVPTATPGPVTLAGCGCGGKNRARIEAGMPGPAIAWRRRRKSRAPICRNGRRSSGSATGSKTARARPCAARWPPRGRCASSRPDRPAIGSAAAPSRRHRIHRHRHPRRRAGIRARPGRRHRSAAARRLSDAPLDFQAGDNARHRRTSPCRWKCATRRRGWKSRAKTRAGAVQLLDTGGSERRVGPGLGGGDGKRTAAAVRCLLSGAGADAIRRSGKRHHQRVDRPSRFGAVPGRYRQDQRQRCRCGAEIPQGRRRSDPFRRSAHVQWQPTTLVPVSLRTGGRYLGSAMAWNQPQHLASFPARFALQRPGGAGEVTVSRQILAEPSAESVGPRLGAADRRHAPGDRQAKRRRLDRAVPHHRQPRLVDPAAVGTLRGHAEAASGACRRERRRRRWRELSSLAPLSVLDGFGRLEPPTPDIAPIAARDFERTDVSIKHPPGLYGAQWRRQRAERNGCAMPRSRP